MLTEQVEELINEHVSVNPSRTSFFLSQSPCLSILVQVSCVEQAFVSGNDLTLSTFALSVILMNGRCFLDGSSSPVAKMACSRSGGFSSSAACLLSRTKNSSFLTGSASNSLTTVPATAVCFGMGRLV